MVATYTRPSYSAATFALIWGLAALLGGPSRFGRGSTTVAGNFAPWWVWGVAMIVYAFLLVAMESRRSYWLVFVLGGVPYAFLTASFLNELSVDGHAATTGAAVYSAMWMFHIFVGARMEVYRACKTGWVAKMVAKDRKRLESMADFDER